MGGVARAVGRVVGGAGRLAVNFLPMAVGFATGNPWLVAATAGGTAAVSGGNFREILGGAVTAGLGSHMGSSLGSSLGGSVGKALAGGGATRPILGMIAGQQLGSALGSGLGVAVMQSAQRQQEYRQALTEGTGIEAVPSFEDTRRNAVVAARRAFERNNIYDGMVTKDTASSRNIYRREPGRYARALQRSNVPRYGARLWKDLVKPRRARAA